MKKILMLGTGGTIASEITESGLSPQLTTEQILQMCIRDSTYTAQMIATLTRHQIGTVERALSIFQQLGLVEQLDCGMLYMTDIELMIGQSSTKAERKRAARLENKALLPPRTNGGHLSDIRPPEIEIKKEIDIELEKEGELKGQALSLIHI